MRGKATRVAPGRAFLAAVLWGCTGAILAPLAPIAMVATLHALERGALFEHHVLSDFSAIWAGYILDLPALLLSIAGLALLRKQNALLMVVSTAIFSMFWYLVIAFITGGFVDVLDVSLSAFYGAFIGAIYAFIAGTPVRLRLEKLNIHIDRISDVLITARLGLAIYLAASALFGSAICLNLIAIPPKGDDASVAILTEQEASRLPASAKFPMCGHVDERGHLMNVVPCPSHPTPNVVGMCGGSENHGATVARPCAAGSPQQLVCDGEVGSLHARCEGFSWPW